MQRLLKYYYIQYDHAINYTDNYIYVYLHKNRQPRFSLCISKNISKITEGQRWLDAKRNIIYRKHSSDLFEKSYQHFHTTRGIFYFYYYSSGTLSNIFYSYYRKNKYPRSLEYQWHSDGKFKRYSFNNKFYFYNYHYIVSKKIFTLCTKIVNAGILDVEQQEDNRIT